MNEKEWLEFCDDYAHILMDVATGDIGYSTLKRLCNEKGADYIKAIMVVEDYKRILTGKHYY